MYRIDKIVRSRRKTLSIEIKNGEVIVRSPLRTPCRDIEEFVSRHGEWIEKHIKKEAERQKALPDIEPLTAEELKALAEVARTVIPARADHYSKIVGVSYGRLTVRAQRTKWGSCSSRGNLNFNCLLMLAPPEVLDSVVVHELCHLKEMNHSDRFYAEVVAAFPDYRRCDRWLRENGPALMMRLPRKDG